ncbi:amidase signature enzyme [Dipodascopsis uninucleata]
MSVARLPEVVSLSAEKVQELAAKNNVKVPEKDVDAYRIMLSGLDELAKLIIAEDDFVPEVDFKKYPRKDVKPRPAENEYNAWATKVTVPSSEKGLLEGQTIVIKDNINLASIPSMLGTDALEPNQFIPKYDATVVRRVLDAGATIIGKAACENFSMSPTSFTNAYGYVTNPLAQGYNAGGSSSGCGALVGAKVVKFAIGGDQGGSIRIPASYCGIVGLKPTFGLVPYTGIASLAAMIDHTGPMTQNVLDNALLLQVLAGPDGLDDRQIGLPLELPAYYDELKKFSDSPASAVKGFKIAIIKESFEMPGMDSRVVEKIREAARAYEKLGCTVEEISFPLHKLAPAIWTIATRQGFAEHGIYGMNPVRFGVHDANLTELLAHWNQEMFDKLAKGNPAATNALLGGQYIKDEYPGLTEKAINLGRKLKIAYNKLLEEYDILITPSAPTPANKASKRDDDIMTKMSKAIGTTQNTMPFNISGNPAISIPIANLPPVEDESLSLPIGMQIVAKSFGEMEIYKAAYAWEQCFDWKSF